MDDHDNFYDCRTNNCSCYKPIDYFDTSNNFHTPTTDNATIATCNGSSATHT